jgi:cation:H+ antiporter
MDPLTLGLFILGLVFLILGAEFLVRGASDVAAAFGVSQLVIGLTVVSMGTSAPEMAVSVNAAFAGNADIALGNVVGSNIFNVLFILGLSAMIVPLTVDRKLVWVDVPLMIAVSGLMWWMCMDGNVDRRDGLILVAGIVLYTGFTVIMGRRRPKDLRPADEIVRTPLVKNKPIIVSLVMIAIGLGLLVLGSKWLVDGAVVLAKAMGLSELVIGLTIVAAGTSLPEVATSVMAAIRGKRDIAVGNVIGSNIFNILGILGLTAAIAPAGINVADSALALDLPFMVAVAVACLPIFFIGHSISRGEGLLFFLYYAAYTAYLILAANKYENLGTYSTALFVFVSPLVAVTLLIRFARALRRSRGEPAVKA